MKWSKKFEELSPELIRRAGNQLIYKGHSEREKYLFGYENDIRS